MYVEDSLENSSIKYICLEKFICSSKYLQGTKLSIRGKYKYQYQYESIQVFDYNKPKIYFNIMNKFVRLKENFTNDHQKPIASIFCSLMILFQVLGYRDRKRYLS